jgi:hypothetical protein
MAYWHEMGPIAWSVLPLYFVAKHQTNDTWLLDLICSVHKAYDRNIAGQQNLANAIEFYKIWMQ